ncbi:MAG: thioredoxin family protein [Halobacteriovoraceae bacterium]|nr:thioredoxin family protein [Halobacteriovoraceae bacterium]|tara:strand:- start:25461 stop:26054 length:594 start_codon:yes stop_codon:yes gene_type:complete
MRSLLMVSILISSALYAVNPGDQAPSFKLKDQMGKEVSLSDFKDKIVVLEWYNQGCPFVRKHYDAGNMQKTQKEVQNNEDVVWLTINSSAKGKQGHLKDSKAALLQLKEEKSNALHMLLDHNGSVGQAYGAKTTPHIYVIGKKGMIQYVGAMDSISSANKADIPKADNYALNAVNRVIAGQKPNPQKTRPYGCSVKY